MKITFQESKWGVDFQLTPETTDEVSQLARFAKNTKAEKPNVYLSFSSSPVCYLSIKKVAEKNQRNSISNSKK